MMLKENRSICVFLNPRGHLKSKGVCNYLLGCLQGLPVTMFYTAQVSKISIASGGDFRSTSCMFISLRTPPRPPKNCEGIMWDIPSQENHKNTVQIYRSHFCHLKQSSVELATEKSNLKTSIIPSDTHSPAYPCKIMYITISQHCPSAVYLGQILTQGYKLKQSGIKVALFINQEHNFSIL